MKQQIGIINRELYNIQTKNTTIIERMQLTKMNNNPTSFITLLNMKQPLFVLLNFLGCQDLENLYRSMENDHQQSDSRYQHLNLIMSFILNRQYMNKVDRAMFYFMYESQLSQQIDRTSIFNVAQNFTLQAKQVLLTYNTLFKGLKDKCNMSDTQVNSFKQMITEPALPLPISIRSNVGKYCNSTFQLFVCSKVAQSDLHMNEQSQFQVFKDYLLQNQQNYMKNILINSRQVGAVSIIQNVKELYYSPQLLAQDSKITVQSVVEGNQLFNFLILTIQLSKNLIKSIKIQLSSLESDLYAYFTQFVLRYSLYKSFVLQLQEMLGSVFEQFNSMFEDLVNVNIGKTNKVGCGFSAWKVLMRMFSNQMYDQMNRCLPIYINLVHKLKIIKNDQIYQRTNLSDITNVIPQLEHYEGSPVLEYLQNSQISDCLQVFLIDFAQMFIDLSIDQNNALWCGHSGQSLGSIFHNFQDSFIRYQSEVLRRLSSSTQSSSIQSQIIQQVVETQFSNLLTFFGIKPRTLRNLLNELDTSLISIDFQTTDRELVHINKQVNHCFRRQDLFGSQKSADSAITKDSEHWHNDVNFEYLQYQTQISEQEEAHHQTDL